jgi:exodeoxyribonuclease V beta subunit
MSAAPLGSDLDLRSGLPRGLSAVEASAGTGKTYALTALAVRGIVMDGVRTEQLLVATFTRAAAAELRGRIREGLRDASVALRTLATTGTVPDGLDDWLDALCRDGGGPDDPAPPPEESQRRARAAAQALSTLDRATITTLHGFFQSSLAQLGLRGMGPQRRLTTDVQRRRRDVVRDRILALLVEDPSALRRAVRGGERESPAAVEQRIDELVKHVLSSGARVAPIAASSEATADETARFVDAVVDELRRRLDAEAELTFDELTRTMRVTLDDAREGDVAVRQLRSRLRLVLVDEMQDTDADQWNILRRAFLDDPQRCGEVADVVIVGDPKQSIYRFRGADIDAYLEASEAAGGQHRSLTRNWRSSASLLEALDVLLTGSHFGGERIAYHRVQAGRDTGMRVHATGAPLELRWLPRDLPLLELSKDGTSIIAASGDAAILDDLAQRVVELLRRGRIDATDAERTDPAVILDADGTRALAPRDIAVLVRTNRQASDVVERLAEAGVAAVQPKGGRVYATEAFDQWRLLLTALARPSDLDAVRALLVSWFVAMPLAAVDDEHEVDLLQKRCTDWRELVAADGAMALLAALRADVDIAPALARAAERGLTDLEHLAELLHVALGARGAPAPVALRTLEELSLSSDRGEDDTDDPSVRRIGSDGDAAQVMTFHGAKGLEFPVVLLPYSNRPQSLQQPWVFRSRAGRIVDAGSGLRWKPVGDAASDEVGAGHPDDPHATMARREATAREELAGDEARLLYVALTRARDRCIVWWWPLQRADSTMLGRLLFGERADGALVAEGEVPRLVALDDATTRQRLAALADAGEGTIDVHEIGPPDRTLRHRPQMGVAPSPLSLATLGRDIHEPDVWRWSFTGLLRSTPRGGLDRVEQVPEPTGVDEPDVPEVAAVAATGRERIEGGTPPAHASGPLVDLPGGTAFGVLVHEALEVVDLAADPVELATSLRAQLAERAMRAAMSIDVERVADGLAAAIATPLEPLAAGLRLCDIAAADRIPELVFELTVGDTRERVDIASLGEAVAGALDPDDPYRAAFATLGARIERARFAGWLTGVVDLAMRLPDGRYVVADYKTNRLSDASGAPSYDEDAMHAAMLQGEYALQALLYQVGMHRILSRRLAGYDPAVHLGGSAFLFLRGMAGPSTPLRDGVRDGVCVWRPAIAAVLAADDVLRGRSGR